MNSRLHAACRLALGAVFLVAGVMKLVHQATFFSDLLGYRLPFPELALRLIATSLPWLEVSVGLGLLLNFWPETIQPVVSFLCVGFVVFLGQAIIRGLDPNCGCFGPDVHGWLERPDVALARAVILLGISVFVLLRRPHSLGC
jgi:putative oxidoreductase